MELWEKKKERLFGEEIGNYRVIWSQKFNTCLAGNIYNAPTYFNGGQKSYSIFIIDLLTDETLFSFMLSGDEQEDGGMTFEGAIKKYESFGLKV
jgi:hypothetical protein